MILYFGCGVPPRTVWSQFSSVKLSENAAFENFVTEGIFEESAGTEAGGCTASTKQQESTLPIASYDVLRAVNDDCYSCLGGNSHRDPFFCLRQFEVSTKTDIHKMVRNEHI